MRTYQFDVNHGVVAIVSPTDDPAGFDVSFPQQLPWLPTGMRCYYHNYQLPITEDRIRQDLCKQIDIWYNDWVATGEPWD